MQIDDINGAFNVVGEGSITNDYENGVETPLTFSPVQEVEEPKDVNQYLEYMRQKREALERAATFETLPDESSESQLSGILEEGEGFDQNYVQEDSVVVGEINSEETEWSNSELDKGGEEMKKKDSMETQPGVDELNFNMEDTQEYSYQEENMNASDETSIEYLVSQVMKQDDILLYQQKYIESLEARKAKVEAIISMLEAEKATIDTQIQAVK